MGKATACKVGTLNTTSAFNSPRCLSEGCRRLNKSLHPSKPPCLSRALQKANRLPLPMAVQPSCGTSHGTIPWHHPMAPYRGTLTPAQLGLRVLDHSPTRTDPAQGSLQISATTARNLHSDRSWFQQATRTSKALLFLKSLSSFLPCACLVPSPGQRGQNLCSRGSGIHLKARRGKLIAVIRPREPPNPG